MFTTENAVLVTIPMVLLLVLGYWQLHRAHRVNKDRNSDYADEFTRYNGIAETLKAAHPLTMGIVSRIGTSARGGTQDLTLIVLEGDQRVFRARSWDPETALTKVGDSISLYADADGKIYVLENHSFRAERHRPPVHAGVVGWAW